MRIAAISHSCVVDVNQEVFAELERQEDLDLLVVAPERWRSALQGETRLIPLAGLADKIVPLTVRFPGNLALHTYPGLGRTLEAFGPDVIYADEDPHSACALTAALCARRLGCRFVFSTKQNLLRYYPWPFSRVERFVFSTASGAIVVNQATANVLRAKGYRGRVNVVAHGVDPALFRPQADSELRRRLFSGRPLVGYVGRLAEEKGLLELCKAAEMVAARGVEFKLVMIGDGPLKDRLGAMLGQLAGKVITAVSHDRIADYMAALDVLVLPSRTTPTWKEQFGRVIIEALACEVAVIGSDSGHIPHLIETTGGGVVFREGDAADLAAKLEEMLRDAPMRQALAARGREMVLRRYTNAQIAVTLGQALRAAGSP